MCDLIWKWQYFDNVKSNTVCHSLSSIVARRLNSLFSSRETSVGWSWPNLSPVPIPHTCPVEQSQWQDSKLSHLPASDRTVTVGSSSRTCELPTARSQCWTKPRFNHVCWRLVLLAPHFKNFHLTYVSIFSFSKYFSLSSTRFRLNDSLKYPENVGDNCPCMDCVIIKAIVNNFRTY